MRGIVARVLSTLLGGLVGFILGSILFATYARILAHWETIIQESAKYIHREFQETVWLTESREVLRTFVNALMLAGFAIGYFFTPVVDFLLGKLTYYLNEVAEKTTRQRFIVTSLGVFAGMLVSALIINAPLFYYLAGLKGGILAQPFAMAILHVLIVLIFGYAGGYLTSAVFFPPSSRDTILSQYPLEPKPRILDTSVLIDGRIAEILKTGFLPGLLVIPQCVVHELQLVADSSDPLKRNKGRRGLEILNNLEGTIPNPIHFYDDSAFDTSKVSVDDIIIEIAKELGGEVVTTDYNLNRVASINKVTVLNVNELANAVKPMVIPGERLTLTIIKEGKEPHQGVGYLEDGTMVVVEAGEEYIGKTCEVEVTSIMQTVAGRLIFSKIHRILDGDSQKE